MEKTKICSKCKEEKPATSECFGRRKASKDGLAPHCKACESARAKAWYKENKEKHRATCDAWRKANLDKAAATSRKWSKANPEKVKAKAKEWYITNTEKARDSNRKWNEANPGRRSAISKEWYIANPDKACAASVKWQKSNPEKVRSSARAWRKNNKDKVQLGKLKRRTLKNKLPSTLTDAEWGKCKNVFDNKCAYCGSDENTITLDHFHPLSKGGELSVKNAIPSCQSCNSSKGTKTFFEWYPKYKHYSKERESKIIEYLNYQGNTQQLSIL